MVTNHVHVEIVMTLKMVILKVPFVYPGKYLNTLCYSHTTQIKLYAMIWNNACEILTLQSKL